MPLSVKQKPRSPHEWRCRIEGKLAKRIAINKITGATMKRIVETMILILVCAGVAQASPATLPSPQNTYRVCAPSNRKGKFPPVHLYPSAKAASESMYQTKVKGTVKLPCGERVVMLGQNGLWARVKVITTGKTGYVFHEWLRKNEAGYQNSLQSGEETSPKITVNAPSMPKATGEPSNPSKAEYVACMAPSILLFKNPHSSEYIEELKRGSPVAVLDREGDVFKVKASSGKVGYVKKGWLCKKKEYEARITHSLSGSATINPPRPTLPAFSGSINRWRGIPNSAKPWPKFCLTGGCTAQWVVFEAAGLAGAVYAAKRGYGNYVVTPQMLARSSAAIEAAFPQSVSSLGYVPYSSIPAAARTPKGLTVSVDRMFGANRSVSVSSADVAFVSKIVNRLKHGRYRVTNFRWTIVPTKTINSMAIPSPPFVFVFTSMLNFTHYDPDAMAFIIGHEIGHTIDAAACSGSGSASNAELGLALALGPRAGRLLPSLAAAQLQKFCENHADNIGLQLAAGAGFNPYGAIKLFKDLSRYYRRRGVSGLSQFLGNHPLDRSRIKNVEKLVPIIQKKLEKTNP